jgi:bacterioferritin
MEILIPILSDIVRAEYAQWMRYTYLSSLGFGLNTDPLCEHFEEHANDELEHAELISRWIVDLGGAPPTDLNPVEQFCGSVEEALVWLAEAEMEGIHKYNDAYAIVSAIGLYGLENDIGTILSTEHEHLSDLTKHVIPSMRSEESSPLIIVAEKIAQTGRDLLEYIKVTLFAADWFENPEFDDINSAKNHIKSIIERDIVPLYEAYQAGDESKRHNLEELKWYYEAINSMDDKTWAYMYNEALYPDMEPYTEYGEHDQPPKEIKVEDVWENIKQIEPPESDIDTDPIEAPVPQKTEQRRPIEKIMVKPTQGTIPEPARVGSYVYSRSVGLEGQIKEILSEDKVRVINTKTGEEETWSTEGLHLSNKPH